MPLPFWLVRLAYSTEPKPGYCLYLHVSPIYWPGEAIANDPEAYRSWLRVRYRQRPRVFKSEVREIEERGLTLVGPDHQTAVLYDCLCRVALSMERFIGEPLEWAEIVALVPSQGDQALYANKADQG